MRGAAALLTALALAALAACGRGEPPAAPQAGGAQPGVAAPAPPALAFDAGGVRLRLSDGSWQTLAEPGAGAVVHVSPDGAWIAVDEALSSTLQITRLLQRQADGRYAARERGNDVSDVAWRTVAKQRGIDADAVERPRTRFVAWRAQPPALEVELTGVRPDGADLRETLMLHLPHLATAAVR